MVAHRHEQETSRAKATAAHEALAGHGPLWAILGPGTTDFPGLYVARLWSISDGARPTDIVITGETVEDVRAALPRRLTCFARSPEDEPNIIESWI